MENYASNPNTQSTYPTFPMQELMKSAAMKLDAKNKAIEFMIENYVCKNAIPEIKGKITKGKIKWRGIKMFVGFDYTVFKQRDKVISPYLNHYTLELTDENPSSLGLCFPIPEIYSNAYKSALSDCVLYDNYIKDMIK